MAAHPVETEMAATGVSKDVPNSTLVEDVDAVHNLHYDDAEIEPEFHARTFLALLSMFMLNAAIAFALQGPPSVLGYIGQSLNAASSTAWVPNALTLTQAIIGPIISLASDTFQARKSVLVYSCMISVIGCAIAPGAKSIARLILAQVLIGVGFSAQPLAYCIPSEILPRKWMPMVQALNNVAAGVGNVVAPVVAGSLIKANAEKGWRNFYWVQLVWWAISAIGVFIGYRPPKRHTRLDHLTLLQKLGYLDIPGGILLTLGLTLFIVGVNSGGNIYAWTSAHVLATMIIGVATLATFGIWEWKGTKNGILHHELFQKGKALGQTYSLCVALILLEGAILFSYVIVYPIMTTALFETDPLLVTVRIIPFWLVSALSTVGWGYASTKFRTIREPLFLGYLIWTAGNIGWATIQPGDSATSVAMSALAGLGFGAPLVLIVAGVQLSTPHDYIATATAATLSARAIGATIFAAIYTSVLNNRIAANVPSGIAGAAKNGGLPATSIPAFVAALAGNVPDPLENIPGVTPTIIAAGTAALRQGMADSCRIVFIIAVPLGVLGCVLCCFLGDLRKTMNYVVEAPLENLHAKGVHHHDAEQTS